LSLTASFHRLWKALGHPDYVTKIGILRLVGMAVLVFPAAETFGLKGVALTVLVAYLVIAIPLDLHLVKRTIGLDRYRLLPAAGYPFLASLLMGAVVFAVRRSLDFGYPSLEFVLLVGTGVVAYVSIAFTLVSLFGWDLHRDIQMIVDSFKT